MCQPPLQRQPSRTGRPHASDDALRSSSARSRNGYPGLPGTGSCRLRRNRPVPNAIFSIRIMPRSPLHIPVYSISTRVPSGCGSSVHIVRSWCSSARTSLRLASSSTTLSTYGYRRISGGSVPGSASFPRSDAFPYCPDGARVPAADGRENTVLHKLLQSEMTDIKKRHALASLTRRPP